MSIYRLSLVLATLLTMVVLPLGAYVRLSDAGLGCPDWPGCYGHLVGVPDTEAEIAAAGDHFPQQQVETEKAWKEMIHRYAAGTLGLLILSLVLAAWFAWWRGQVRHRPWLESGLLMLVIFQALLGMWTVTELLKPVIVTAHLLGGMATWTLLVLLLGRKSSNCGWLHGEYSRSRTLGFFALILLVAQIALGGWVSSNYAALACTDFPTCQGQWWPQADYQHAFQLHRELGQTASGELLPMAALTAIHWVHRVVALLVLIFTGWHALRLMGQAAGRRLGSILLTLLLAQISLGVANVLLSLPIQVAVAHNLGAALLLATLALSLRR